jgi:S-adenosylmethionine:tRNA ribosyltransferase-isomerase
MQIQDFDYALPQHLIAQTPAARRGDARLLHLPRGQQRPVDRRFSELPALLRPGDLLVLNDTRVVQARLSGRKHSGGRVEVMVERAVGPHTLLAQIRASRGPRAGTTLLLGESGLAVQVRGRRDDLFELELPATVGVDALLRSEGRLPLPPYIQRPPDAADAERYQTVYAQHPGAVAAPTAGLHFDHAMLARLEREGIRSIRLTLHVGAGTFTPVRGEDIEAHVMHPERVEVGVAVCEAVADTRARGGRVVAVGTTCVRALESAAAGGCLVPLSGDTRLFIKPGFRFRVVDLLLTNFHLPRSTLLMLVSAFAGRERVLAAYAHAVAQGYRFFSYGDATLLEPSHGEGNA